MAASGASRSGTCAEAASARPPHAPRRPSPRKRALNHSLHGPAYTAARGDDRHAVNQGVCRCQFRSAAAPRWPSFCAAFWPLVAAAAVARPPPRRATTPAALPATHPAAAAPTSTPPAPPAASPSNALRPTRWHPPPSAPPPWRPKRNGCAPTSTKPTCGVTRCPVSTRRWRPTTSATPTPRWTPTSRRSRAATSPTPVHRATVSASPIPPTSGMPWHRAGSRPATASNGSSVPPRRRAASASPTWKPAARPLRPD